MVQVLGHENQHSAIEVNETSDYERLDLPEWRVIMPIMCSSAAILS